MGFEWQDITNDSLPEADAASRYVGRDLLEQSGAKIGRVDQVLYDGPADGRLAVIRLGLLGTSWHFVPLDGARESGGGVMVPYSKEFIKQAPTVRSEGQPSERDLAELRSYYGIPARTRPIRIVKRGGAVERVETSEPTVGERMHEASDVVSSKASEAVDRGRGVVADQIGQRSTQLSDQIGSASQTMRRVADQARTDGNSQHARLADQAAERGDRVSGYLQEVEPEQLLSDVEDFARRQPWVVAGVGLFIGFALARSLKASSGRRYEARSYPSRYQGNGGPAWTASPGAPREVLANTPARTAGTGHDYA